MKTILLMKISGHKSKHKIGNISPISYSVILLAGSAKKLLLSKLKIRICKLCY